MMMMQPQNGSQLCRQLISSLPRVSRCRSPIRLGSLLQKQLSKSIVHHSIERASTFSPATVIVDNYISSAAVPPLQRSSHRPVCCSSLQQQQHRRKHCITNGRSGSHRLQQTFGAKNCPPKAFLASGATNTITTTTSTFALVPLLSETVEAVSFDSQTPSVFSQASRRISLEQLSQKQQQNYLNYFSTFSTLNFPVFSTSLLSISFSLTKYSIFSAKNTCSLSNYLYYCSYRSLSTNANHCHSQSTQSTTKKMDHLTQTTTAITTKTRSCSFFDSSSSSSSSCSDSEQDNSPSLSTSPSSTPVVESPLSQLPKLSESGHLAGSRFPVQLPNLMKLKVAGGNDNGNVADSSEKVYRIIVEGNIGSGKTTFLKIFAKNCESMLHKPLIVPEPIDLWRDVGGANIFQLLADDPKRWSFAFQSYVQLTMIKIHEMQPEAGSHFKVMERSLFSARYCFVENLLEKGLLSTCEHFILDEWFKASLPAATVDMIIYLKSDPDVVFERIKARGRPEEAGITLEYLRTLHELHEDWLIRGKFPLPAQVLTIDANTPLEQIVSVYEAKTDGILRKNIVSV